MTDAATSQEARPLPVPRSPNMIAVASGKGGVGKTWLSITLAHALAGLGRRTLLFDGDLGLANVDIQLGLMPKRDLGSVLEGVIPLPAAAQPYADGAFDIVAGRSGSATLSALPPHRLAELQDDLASLAASYDHVILDLGAGIDRLVRQMAQQAGIILAVSNDEPTSLTDAYAFIKVMHARAASGRIHIVVNMASSMRAGESTYATLSKACRTFLGIEPPLAGIIRQDRRVRDAIRAQTPLLTRTPSSPASEDVTAMARGLARQR